MTVYDAIAIVKSKAECRTRYDGQEPRVDEVLASEVERLRVSEKRLKAALEGLMDWQNGPPLPTYRDGWGDAMKEARAAIDASEAPT